MIQPVTSPWGPLRWTAKVSLTSYDKNGVKHFSHRAAGYLRRLLKLVHTRNEMRCDTDFLGYEAFCSLGPVTFGCLSPRKTDEKADKAESVEPVDEVLSRTAA